MKEYSRCVDNVVVLDNRLDIIYAGYSRLEADFMCMKELMKKDQKWQFLINLCGQDFPIKTNSEIAAELKSLKGSVIPSTKITVREKKIWYMNRYVEITYP